MSEQMTTIGSVVRAWFIAILRDEIFELEDRAETLKKAEMFDPQLNAHLSLAHESLAAARERADVLMGRA